MRGFFFAGDKVSEGLNNLRAALNIAGHRMLRLKAEGSAFVASRDKFLINWGTTTGEINRLANNTSRVLNRTLAVGQASNKRTALQTFTANDVKVPPFCTELRDAINLLTAARVRVYARTIVNGSSGDGIILLLRDDDPAIRNNANFGNMPVIVFHHEAMNIVQIFNGDRDNLVNRVGRCTLFTIGRIGVRTEYRVHIFNGEVIHKSVKLRRNRDEDDDQPRNHLVRNLENGWIYSNDTDDLPQDVIDQSLKAVQALGLDFGAVDLLYYPREGDAIVLEVNTAPGLAPESSALKAYCDAIIKFAEQ